jgi:hypothetical protein
MTKNEITASTSSITLTSGQSTTAIPISQKDTTESHTTLGVRLAPTGDDSDQVKHLRTTSDRMAALVASSKLSKIESLLAYRMNWTPSISYSLGTSTMSPTDLAAIQSAATSSFLNKLGINRNFPRAVVFGPKALGGLELRNLCVEQGVQQLTQLMAHVYNSTVPGQLILIALQTLQMEAGTSHQLLLEPIPIISYITPCWLSSIRTFSALTN